MARPMDAAKALGAAAGLVRIAPLRSSDADVTAAPKHHRQEAPTPEVEDRISFSKEVRIRQDVVRTTEEQRSEDAGSEDPLASGMGAEAASAAERERMRELLLRDIETRTAGAAGGVDGTIRSLPSFEYDIGPYGRAYAVGDGAVIERPEVEASEVAHAQDPARAAEEAPASREEARRAAQPSETTDHGAAAVPPNRSESTPEPEQAKDLGWSTPAIGERTARAYQSALDLAEAPGGFEGSTVDLLG